MRKKRTGKPVGWRIRLAFSRKYWRWPALLLPYRKPITIGLAVLVVLTVGVTAYLYVSYSRIIEARLHGERDRAVPRVFARPLTLQAGQSLSQADRKSTRLNSSHSSPSRMPSSA